MKKRIISMIMALTLGITMLPGNIAYGAETTESENLEVESNEVSSCIYYVSDTTGSDGGSGTYEAPLKTLEKALALAVDGDEIYVIDSVLVNDETGLDTPLVIKKDVTIKGNANTLSTISLRAGGIILGADVTFENVKIGTAGFIRPGIAANGHKLVLNNVHKDSSLRPLQIYGGTFCDYSTEGTGQGKDYGADIRGEESQISIVGGSYEGIYAGSTNGTLGQPVSISVSKGNGLTIDNGIYAGSTSKNPSDTSMAGMIPKLDEGIFIGTCEVNLTISDNANVKIVDAVDDNHTMNLTVDGTGSYSFAVEEIDSLTVTGGTFIPAKGSLIGTGGNTLDITLTGSESNKATLDLSEACIRNSIANTITVNNFTGSANGILVLNSEAAYGADGDTVLEDVPALDIQGTLSGGPTEFRVNGGMPWSSADNEGYSGWIEYETTYISGATNGGSGTFAISNPYPNQTEVAFAEGSSAQNGWKTGEGSAFQPPELIDFTPVSQTVTYVEINAGGINMNVLTVFDQEEEYPELGYVPMDYKITYSDANNNVTEYIKQSAIEDEYGYYVCSYNASTNSTPSDELLMKLEPITETIFISKGDGEFAAGTYEIEMTTTTTSGIVTKSCTLTVLADGETAPVTTTAEINGVEDEDILSYGNILTLQAIITDEESNAVTSGEAQLYINNIAYGKATISNGIATWKNVSVSEESGFQIGNNVLAAVYLGDNDYGTSVSENIFVSVTKTTSGISYIGENESVNLNYDGLNHPFVPEENTIKICDEIAGTVLVENPEVNKDYVILYTTDSSITENTVFTTSVPNKTDTYYVYLKVLETDYWEECITENSVATIVISTVKPTVTVSGEDFEHTKSGDVITVSGSFQAEVVGPAAGIIPEGKISITLVHSLDINNKVELEAVSLVNGKATFEFFAINQDYLGYVLYEYIPSESQGLYDVVSDDFYHNLVLINNEGSTDFSINGIQYNELYFPEGQRITVNAGTGTKCRFVTWEFSEDADRKVPVVSDLSAKEISFMMPDGEVNLTAIWKEHELDVMEEKEATCTQEGNEAYWKCSACKKLFSDEDGIQEITEADVKIPIIEHNYSKTWSYDETNHWHKCTCGAEADKAKHIPGAEATEESAQLCTECGYEIAPKLNHSHWGGTASCNALAVCGGCGKTYGEKDGNNHAGGTEVRNAKEAKEFEEGYTGDTYCLGCEKLLQAGTKIPATHKCNFETSWSYDETNHWHKCTCGAEADKAKHIPGAEATEESAQLCTECGYEIAPKLNHSHWGGTASCNALAVCGGCGKTYGEKDGNNHAGGTEVRNAKVAKEFEEGYTGDTYCLGCEKLLQEGTKIPATHKCNFETSWSYDETNHWHKCTCGAEADKAKHIPGAEATEESAQLCTECGYEIAPKLEDVPEEKPDVPEEKPDIPEEKPDVPEEKPDIPTEEPYTGLKKVDGQWFMYEKGVISYKYNSLTKYNGSWWYVKNSKVDFGYTGLCNYSGNWWYIKNGKLDFSYTGLCNYNGSWWYVEKGILNWNYTGLCKYSGSWWYVKSGKLDFGYTGLCKYNGSWWYIKSGKLDFGYTGLCKYNGSWWYIKSGKLDFGYTSLCKYNGSWWYIKSGKLDFGYTGLCNYSGNWWYIEKGILNWNYTGLCKYGTSWYYVQKGMLNWNYTGLCRHGSTWYYVQKGILNWNYTGYVKHSGLSWDVRNGVMIKMV